MSGGKARGKQPCDTAVEDALLQLQALHQTHREATRLFLMAARQGATDEQIADALRQGLPHLTDPASLQGIEVEGIEKGKQPAAQQKRTRTTRQATQTQPALLAADAFAAALEAIPADDWSRTWAADRTITLRRTSKRVQEVVDKVRLPAVVRLSRSSWDDARNGTAAEKLQFVFKQLAALTAQCRISTLELPRCEMKGQDAERLAGVLAQCPALAHLDLSGNSNFGATGAERLAGVLGQCRELVHLNLSGNDIRAAGVESLAEVLAQCPALAHLDLSDNYSFGAAGAERLGGVLAQCTALTHLNLRGNYIRAGGTESLAGVLGQCAALAHLNLSGNAIRAAGAESLAGVLGQCAALAHLNLSENGLQAHGAESLARVLAQCTVLAHLDLSDNWIQAHGAERLAGVLVQCQALVHLNLSGNIIRAAGAESLAEVLAQCAALSHLDLSGNLIGAAGAESLAGVLAQCRALGHLHLRGNQIGAVAGGRLRALWRGQASGLVL